MRANKNYVYTHHDDEYVDRGSIIKRTSLWEQKIYVDFGKDDTPVMVQLGLKNDGTMESDCKGTVYSTISLVSILQIKIFTMAKDDLMRWENVLGKIQPFERYYEVAFVFRRAAQLCE